MAAAGVLHVTTGLNGGGAEIVLMCSVTHQDRTRFRSSVLSPMNQGPNGPVIRESRIAVDSLGMTGGKLLPAKFKRLRTATKSADPVIYHGWMHHGNLVASLGSMTSRKPAPMIWCIHHSPHDNDNEKPLTAKVIRTLARMSRHRFAISYCSRVAVDHHERYRFDSRRRVAIPIGADTEEFKLNEHARARIGEHFSLREYLRRHAEPYAHALEPQYAADRPRD